MWGCVTGGREGSTEQPARGGGTGFPARCRPPSWAWRSLGTAGCPRRGWRSPSAVSWHWLSGSAFSTSWQRARLWESRESCGCPTAGCGTSPWQCSLEGRPGKGGEQAGRVAVGVWLMDKAPGLALALPCSEQHHFAGGFRAGAGTHSPLLGEQVWGAGLAVPGAVGIPGQAAVGAGFAVELAAVQGELEQPVGAAHKQLLLLGQAGQWQSAPTAGDQDWQGTEPLPRLGVGALGDSRSARLSLPPP